MTFFALAQNAGAQESNDDPYPEPTPGAVTPVETKPSAVSVSQGVSEATSASSKTTAAADRTAATRERSQFFWQPLKGFNAIVLTATGTNISYSDLNSSGTATTSVAILNSTYALYYYYGISRLWALSIELSTSPDQTQTQTAGTLTQTSTEGPDDVIVAFRNTTPFGRWNLHYGASFNFSLDLNEPARINSQGNNYSGGNGVTPYIGTTFNVFGKSFLGVRAGYFYRGSRIVDPDRSITEAAQRTSGNVTTGVGFFEWHTFPWLFDLRGTLTLTDSQQTVVLTTNTTSNAYYSVQGTVGLQYFFNRRNMVRVEGSLIETPPFGLSSGLTENNSLTYSGTFSLRREF